VTHVRNFESGDFIFVEKGNCKKCNGLMKINQIYSVKLKKPVAQIKKQETTKTKNP